MTPSNPDNNQPLIYRIMDALGVTHLVACLNHTHDQSEVEGLAAALAGKLAKLTSFTAGNFVKVKSDGTLEDSGKKASDFADAAATATALAGKQDVLTFDSTPTAGSTNPVTSGGVKAALDGKQDALTFDSTPTANSTNPVTSGGVKAALDGKAPAGDTEVVFEEGENLFVYLPSYFTNGERQRSFILNYQGDVKALIDIFGVDTFDAIRILSHDDSIIMVGQCYIAVRVIKQPGGVEQGDVYYIIFDGKNDY